MLKQAALCKLISVEVRLPKTSSTVTKRHIRSHRIKGRGISTVKQVVAAQFRDNSALTLWYAQSGGGPKGVWQPRYLIDQGLQACSHAVGNLSHESEPD
jgi:hypothetical protein